MSQARKRLQMELKKFNDEVPEGFSAGPIDDSDLFNWEASVVGPEDSPFEGGTFILEIKFSRDHPYKHPEIYTQTKIFHPNLNTQSGQVCCCALYFLKDGWGPHISILDMLKAFQNLLINPNIYNVCGLGNEYAAKLWKEDRAKYDSIAKEWTEKYASEY